tara:strand:+ start:1188 stop:1376 length:189 start_codon:yes stop_codon:yes gene_type:complete
MKLWKGWNITLSYRGTQTRTEYFKTLSLFLYKEIENPIPLEEDHNTYYALHQYPVTSTGSKL